MKSFKGYVNEGEAAMAQTTQSGQAQTPTHMPFLTPNEWKKFLDDPWNITLDDLLDDDELIQYIFRIIATTNLAP